MSVAAQARARRKAHIVARTKGVSYTERRAYRQGTGALVSVLTKTAKMAHRSK